MLRAESGWIQCRNPSAGNGLSVSFRGLRVFGNKSLAKPQQSQSRQMERIDMCSLLGKLF